MLYELQLPAGREYQLTAFKPVGIYIHSCVLNLVNLIWLFKIIKWIQNIILIVYKNSFRLIGTYVHLCMYLYIDFGNYIVITCECIIYIWILYNFIYFIILYYNNMMYLIMYRALAFVDIIYTILLIFILALCRYIF